MKFDVLDIESIFDPSKFRIISNLSIILFLVFEPGLFRHKTLTLLLFYFLFHRLQLYIDLPIFILKILVDLTIMIIIITIISFGDRSIKPISWWIETHLFPFNHLHHLYLLLVGLYIILVQLVLTNRWLIHTFIIVIHHLPFLPAFEIIILLVLLLVPFLFKLSFLLILPRPQLLFLNLLFHLLHIIKPSLISPKIIANFTTDHIINHLFTQP